MFLSVVLAAMIAVPSGALAEPANAQKGALPESTAFERASSAVLSADESAAVAADDVQGSAFAQREESNVRDESEQAGSENPTASEGASDLHELGEKQASSGEKESSSDQEESSSDQEEASSDQEEVSSASPLEDEASELALLEDEDAYEVTDQASLQSALNDIAEGTKPNRPIKIASSFELAGPIAVPELSVDYLSIVADAPVVLTAFSGARHMQVEQQGDEKAIFFKNIVLDGNGTGGGIEFAQGTAAFYLNTAPEGVTAPSVGSFDLTVRSCASTDGAALYATDTVLHVSNATFASNTAANRGGAIFLDSEAGIHLEASVLANNAALDGGSLYAVGTGQPALEVLDSLLSGNTASKEGGAVYTERDLDLSSSTLSGNTAHGNGGAGALVSDNPSVEAALSLAHTSMLENKATATNGQGNGGGIYGSAWETLVRIDDSDTGSRESELRNNTAQASGGGMYIGGMGEPSTVRLEMVTGSVSDNTAEEGRGGGICLDGEAAVLTLGESYAPAIPALTPRVLSNHSHGNGGGISLDASQEISLYSFYATIEDNTSDASGGGISFEQATLVTAVFNATSVDENRAEGDGGGIAMNTFANHLIFEAVHDGYGELVAATSVSRNVSGGNGGGLYSKNLTGDAYKMITLQMTGAIVDGNTAQGSGGGIYGDAAESANVQAGSGGNGSKMSISGNTAHASGGGVYLASDESVSFHGHGTTVNDNTAGTDGSRGDGGGIYVASSEGYATFGFNESGNQQANSLTGNHAYGRGGGAYAVSGQQSYAQVEGLDIENNTAEESGGGIFMEAAYTILTMSGGWDPETGDSRRKSLSGNVARTGSGGGAFLRGSHVENHIDRTNAQDNVSYEDGGALYVYADDTREDQDTTLDMSLSESTFTGNEAGESGGAVYAVEASGNGDFWSSLAATSVQFDANAALAGSGGAVYLGPNLSNLSLYNGGSGSDPIEFTGNTAARDGGALFVADGWQTGYVQQVLFGGNTAGQDGGAVRLGTMGDHQNATEMFVSTSSFTGNTAGSSGGGIWTPYENLANLVVDTEGQIGETTVFSGNTASRELESVLLGNAEDIALHDEKIHTHSFSERPDSYYASAPASRSVNPFEYGYNNFDISYRNAAMVLYDGNGATGGAVPVDNRKYLPGEQAEVKTDHTLAREGYTFEGWALEPDGNVAVASPITMEDADVVLYAIWSKLPDPPGPVDPGEPVDPGTSGDPGSSNTSLNQGKHASALAKMGDEAVVGIALLAAMGILTAIAAALSVRKMRRNPKA